MDEEVEDVFTVRLSGGRPWGFTVKEANLDESPSRMYLEISKVEPRGKSAGYLFVGDVLLAIDGVPCKSVEDAKSLMGIDAQNKLSLTLSRLKPETAKVALLSAQDITPAVATAAYNCVVEEQECDWPAHENSNSEVRVTMQVPAETNATSPLKSAILYSSNGQLRTSSSTYQQQNKSAAAPQNHRSASVMQQQQPDEGFSDRAAYMSAVPASKFPRHSLDGYQTCGLPSGTLFRKPTGKRTSFAEPLVTVPVHPVSRTPDNLNRGRRTSVPIENHLLSPSMMVPSPARINPPKYQDALSMVNSNNKDSFSSNGYIYRATPVVAQGSWSQTESPVLTISPIQPNSHGSSSSSRSNSSPSPMLQNDPVHTDVIKLSGVLRSVPSSRYSQQSPQSPRFETSADLAGKDSSWDSECSSSSGVMSSRSSVSSGPIVAADLQKVPSHRFKGARKSLTNTSSSSDELDDYASLAKRRGSESTAMSAVRPQQAFPSDEYNRNKNLTTIKEVRTYQIRPSASDSTLKTSSLHINTGGSASGGSSSSEEYRHKRDASLDSSVSWQSNSTNSSGYSSVALSSSSPPLEMNGSEETLVPSSKFDGYRERSNTTDDRSFVTPASTTSEISSTEPSHRPVSVSEMVRSYSETKIPPLIPPKPSYSFLPAQKPAVPLNNNQRRASDSSAQIINKPASRKVVSFGNDGESPAVAVTAVKILHSAAQNVPVLVENAKKEALRNDEPPRKSQKSSPVYRTGVHGLVLGGGAGMTRLPVIASFVEESEEPVVPDFPEKCRIGEARTPPKQADPPRPPSARSSTSDQELNDTKNHLISRLTAKIAMLKEEQDAIQQELESNDAFGDEVLDSLKAVAEPEDVKKYLHHLKELEEIVALNTSIKSRLSLVETSLAQLILPENELEITTLQTKRKKLSSQLEEVNYLNSGVERRRNSLRKMLVARYMNEAEYADYSQFFTTKQNLLQDHRSLHHKLKLAEEQLISLHSTGSLSS